MSDALIAPVAPKEDQSRERTWLLALGLFGVISVLSLIYLVHSLTKVTGYLGYVNQMEVAAANIVRDVNDATFSRDFEVSSTAYSRLQTDVAGYELALQGAQASNMGNAAIFDELARDWQAKKEQINYVLEHKNDVDALQDLQRQVSEAAKRMQTEYGTAMDQALATRQPASLIREIQAQIVRAERIANEMSALTSSTSSSNAFKEEAAAFDETLKSHVQNFGLAVPALQAVEATYNEFIAPRANELETLSNPAIQSRESAQALTDIAAATQTKLAGIDRSILSQPRIITAAIGLLIGMLGLGMALMRLLSLRSQTERLESTKETLHERQEREMEQERARKIQEENERSQMAILRLLDELGDLAEGDLTVNATVSEDFTGAIADSVNFAIDQLRQLVLAINTTADRVAQSSQQTQKTAVELAEASEHQAQEIAGVSAAINEMAVSIDQVSANASESAAVAQRSVAIAHNGAEVVQRSIEGMNIIRDQIQETSKRIKRLGESSQEIGDIVSLINDIADQTNILALNAAIQASMAGEAGRGFAVVADEVQRLAERSANATRQIETLVKTIQADTNEAVSSMEQTTAEVVRGAKLAKDAGEALEEVQSVSNTLADLIQSISNAAQQQATSAGHISSTMNIIQDITSQTSSGTMATARSVGRLNEMAAALQESVSGFKLSDDDVFVAEDDFRVE
ncbi:MAG: methyl-accepting chemotaxis protein [Moraxella sp.]|nr:methyl-accepting chemotaxis protein [Moraxella sp.]